MGSHRRFVSSETGDEYATGLQPEHALESYGAVRVGARPAYGIATSLHSEAQNPTAGGWLDWHWFGNEKEDAAAAPLSGGWDLKTGKPMAPSAAETQRQQMNKDWEENSILGTAADYWSKKAGEAFDALTGGGDRDKPKGPDWKKLAIVVGVLGGGYVVWSKVIEPKLAQRKAGG